MSLTWGENPEPVYNGDSRHDVSYHKLEGMLFSDNGEVAWTTGDRPQGHVAFESTCHTKHEKHVMHIRLVITSSSTTLHVAY
jgi:hypothetical protein